MAFWKTSSPVEDRFEDSREQSWSEGLLVVLMADDDEDDYLLVRSAFDAGPIRVDLRWVIDGEGAMDYLLRRGNYRAPESSPHPDLILLDIIMPGKDGLETLKEIKGNRKLQKIPVVLLTSSRKEEHEASGLRLGADSFIVKPHDFNEMVRILSDLHEHYFGIIRLPDTEMIPDVPYKKGAEIVIQGAPGFINLNERSQLQQAPREG